MANSKPISIEEEADRLDAAVLGDEFDVDDFDIDDYGSNEYNEYNE